MRRALQSRRVLCPEAGVALIRTLKAIDKLTGDTEDQGYGIKILARAIEEPLRQIVTNAGEDAAVVLNRVKEGKTTSATTPPPASMAISSRWGFSIPRR